MTKQTFVVDTSVVVERAIADLVKQGKITGMIIVPNAVVAELEHLANLNQEQGWLGLEEIKQLRDLQQQYNIEITFLGEMPSSEAIKTAKKFGFIDAAIRNLALKHNATLITADKVQAKVAEVLGIDVMLIEIRKPKEKLSIEKYFTGNIMSIHIKENCYVYGKQGKPGSWQLVRLNNKKLGRNQVQAIAKEIIKKASYADRAFIEISKQGLSIVQFKEYRIIIVRPPIADGYEITVIKPLVKLYINDYKLNTELLARLEKARGVIVAGEPGAGKTTFVQALAEFYLARGKVVKTVESPRDLQLPESITQYSKNFATSQDIHDILFLSRPDYIIFDEMRDTPDFQLYTDLRLAGSECIGVLHAAAPIDAIQRFITRLEIGMIPSVVDTVIFMEAGNITKVLTLELKVKIPTGMKEKDLIRPVIEVRDFSSKALEYEIYKYGEETVIVKIKKQKDKEKQRKKFEIMETKKYFLFITGKKSGTITVYVDGRFVAELQLKHGEAKIKKKSKLGKFLKQAMIEGRQIEAY